MKYVIGTRGSKLALAQAEYVKNRLAQAYPFDEFEILVIKTRGDLVLDKPLHEIGDKGVFVKEIEEKLLCGEIQIAVHSMKDMPSDPADGLLFAKAWTREDPRDALILREKKSLMELPFQAVIATGSKRREIQLKRLRPDLKVVGIRGNIDTRLRKMEEEHLDGIVLAAAGLHRLGLKEKITRYFDLEEMIPAPAQGVLALEIRKGEEKILSMLNALSDETSAKEAEAEREFLRQMGGSCHIPVGAVCRQNPDGKLSLSVLFGTEDASRQAYASVCGNDPKTIAKEAAAAIRRQMAGTVFLVGAGPGDTGLITVKGLQAIKEADCIIYDRLASQKLLKEAKPECEMIYVGKANHNHTMAQEKINALLVQKSMEYEETVRLKGGDVYVFGRGGEEGIFLRENGVSFEVIPGISSSIAGLAYAGIPITHRGISSGFHVVTAHNKEDALADIDFEAMARGKETCVFLMGLGKLAEIADRLLSAGMRKEMGVAVISNATTEEQKTCISDLSHIVEEVKRAGLVSPAIIVAGEVVSLREKLNFFEKKPLFGKRYLIPKIGKETTRLGELLSLQGAVVDEIQVGKIVNTKMCFSKEQLRSVDWLLFTSRNGVNEFFYSLWKSGLDVRSLAECKVAVIGEKTAETLKKYGVFADLVPDEFHSDSLFEALKARLDSSQKVWYVKPKNADSHLKKKLEGFCQFEEIEVYENCATDFSESEFLPLKEYDGVLFTCASSAKRLMEKLKTRWTTETLVYSIGEKTTACLHRCGIWNVLEADRCTYEALEELCIRQIRQK